MSPERVREVLNTTPFRPFAVHTGDGSTVRIIGREFAWLAPPPGGRTLFVSTGRKVGDDDEVKMIDVFLITQITSPARRQNGMPRRGRKRE